MEEKQSRLVRGVEFFYELVKASLYFWFLLVKNGVVYGLLPALSYTMAYGTTTEKKEEKFYGVLTKKRTAIHYAKGFSFAWFFVAGLLVLSISLLKETSQPVVQILSIAVLFSFILFTLYMVWVAWLFVKNPMQKQLYAVALDQLVRHPLISLYGLSLLGTAVLLAWVNLLIFICLAPGIFVWLIDKGFTKSLAQPQTQA
ncbi:hypothetical protein BAU15_12755 [Enterococcus sp. JM4C]|uniref:hypothetical protein n=1 Tax=Candidatus Enterococcus huntleyi TaxID=1857217 RepID=UPI001379786B|nr:hypothetical protein [Enterococcus sp. JM4C]KAF1296420.1 hypothetical protein BAU15_12755 [Enterococcus sp. JM4C]